ncbi:hypothetical protein ACFVW1_52910 [Streptomyces olivochromogenes]|uniref:hypothetical protein n=1 Tax=Streptomyces olivochromogenes TaxID=1963 RepID=UPI0036DCC808
MPQRCRYLRDLGWRDAYQQPVPAMVLLLQDGRFARVRLDWPPQRGMYVPTVNVHLPEVTDFPRDTINAYFWDTRLDEWSTRDFHMWRGSRWGENLRPGSGV